MAKQVYILQEKSISDTQSLIFIRVYGEIEDPILYYVTIYTVDPNTMNLSFLASESVDLQYGLTVFFKRSAFNGRYAIFVTDPAREVILDEQEFRIDLQNNPASGTV